MTKNTQLATIIIGSLILIASISGGVYVYNKKQAEISSLMVEKANTKQMIQQKDSIMFDMDNSFYEIENNLKVIKEKRNQIPIF